MPFILTLDENNALYSPLLEAMGNQLAKKNKRPDLVFDSAGWSVDYSGRLPAGLSAELERRKLGLDSFRAKRLDAQLMGQANLVLCDSETICERARAAFPLKVFKIMTLKDLGAIQQDLPPKTGVDEKAWQACAEAAWLALSAAWPRIVSLAEAA